MCLFSVWLLFDVQSRSSSFLAEFVGFAGNQQTDDETEQAQDGAEDLNDENLDEAACRVSKSLVVMTVSIVK